VNTDPHTGLGNRWKGILVEMGIDADCLTGKQTLCPVCGGKDRFRYDGKDEGMSFCNQCGSRDGYSLLMAKFNWDFKEALARVGKVAGTAMVERHKAEQSDADKAKRMGNLWKEAEPMHGDLLAYFRERGLPVKYANDPMLRWHKTVPYEQGKSAPALLVRYFNRDKDGNPMSCTMQRIWPSLKLKKVMPSPIKMEGVFCPLGGAPLDTLGIAEGVVTALSARAISEDKFPVWATYSAEQMIRFVPPSQVKRLIIFMDTDVSFTGQAASYELAKRLGVSHPDLDVLVLRPCNDDDVDWDFNDELRRRLAAAENAA